MNNDALRGILEYLPKSTKEKLIKDNEEELKNLFLEEIKKEIKKDAKKYYDYMSRDIIHNELNTDHNSLKMRLLVTQSCKEVYNDKEFIDSLVVRTKKAVKASLRSKIDRI